jgi:hypothetical protein
MNEGCPSEFDRNLPNLTTIRFAYFPRGLTEFMMNYFE